MKKIGFLIAITLFWFVNLFAQTEAQIFTDYKLNPKASILPNFSYAGYKNGEQAIDYSGKNLTIFNVTSYGAIANDNISDKVAIKAAIAAASVGNAGGIVFFPAGEFIIQDATDDKTSFSITKSNIILKGSGSGTTGTRLFMKTPLDPSNPTQFYSTPSMFIIGGNSNPDPTLTRAITANAATGDFDIQVPNTTSLAAGDWLLFEMQSTDAASLALDLGTYPVNTNWTSLKNGGVDLSFVLQISTISGNTITLKQPLPYPVNSTLNWTVAKYRFIEEVGVEDIAFLGNFKQTFVHHGSALDDSGYSLLEFKRVINTWMQNCRFTDVSVGASFGINGANITVDNCSITGNGGHQAITNSGATNVLISNINDQAGQFHSVGVSKTSMNTVIYNVTYPASTCFESHASQPRNTLLDNITGGLQQFRAGGDEKEMPNHMRNLVLWNYEKTNTDLSNFRFWPSSSFFKIPLPILVGFHGSPTTFTSSELKYQESNGQAVLPVSLYKAQFALRMSPTAAANGVWNSQSSTYNYNLGINTGTGGTLTSGAIESSFGPPAVPGYLPTPPSGVVRAQVNGTNGDGGSFTLNTPATPAVPTISMKATSTGSTIKLSGFDIDNASEISSMFFNIDFNAAANNGVYVWALGNRNASGSLFTSVSSVFRANTELFTSFEWTIKSSGIDFKFRESANATAAIRSLISSTAFVKGDTSAVEVYANNSTSAKNYLRSNITHTVPAGKFQLWVNGVQLAYNSSVDFSQSLNTTVVATPTSEIAKNVKLDAYLFQANNSNLPTANAAIATISKIKLNYHVSTLPVSLISFTGKKETNGIRLNWKTASELNNDYFDLLRSNEGLNFRSITKVSGNGTSNQINTYSYLDNSAEAGTNYYKLKQVDKDGTETVSDIVVAVSNSLNDEEAFYIQLVGSNELKTQFNAEVIGNATIKIIDINGKTLYSETFSTQKGLNNRSLQLPNLINGLYVATIIQNGKSKSVKIVR
jgi:hypothetical protein